MKLTFLRTAVVAGVIAGFVVPIVALADTQFLGAGATFPYPFFSRAFYAYSQDHAGITVNYASIGSGGGISQFTQKTVDFGASDVPMTKAELQAAMDANGAVVQIPDTLGGIAIAYNVPGVAKHIKLTQKNIAEIMSGKVANWNDASLAAANPGVKFPSLAILVVHRADASGTSFHFTDYLSRTSSDWMSKVGKGKSVNWPTGVGAKGNEGVAGQITSQPGTFGYVELAYAIQNDMSYAAVQNKAGNFVLPSPDSIRAAASQKPSVSPDDFSIANMDGKDSYPICGYSWLLVWKNQADPTKGRQLVDMLKWLVSTSGGQQYAAKVDYVPLPENVQQEALKAIGSIHS